MATLLESINTARENTIATHYSAAVAELEEKVKASPLNTTFNIYAGCVSEEVTKEISHRFNASGVKASVEQFGFIFTQWYIIATPALPDVLVHAEPVKEEIKEEIKDGVVNAESA